MVLDNYDIGIFLGQGGFAKVFRARNRIRGNEVAIKIIPTVCHAVDSGESFHDVMNKKRRILNEIEIHSRLKHENIVQLYEHFSENNSMHLVLEVCAYGNLYKYLRDHGPLDETKSGTVIKQILLALEYLVHKNIIHRDLKLSNVLISSENPILIKLCDFGLATQLEHPDEEHYTLCGTPNYIAPEIQNQRSHSFPADIWSAGCLFYFMVAGAPPFDTVENIEETLRMIKAGTAPGLPSELSSMAIDFMCSLLQLVSHKFHSHFGWCISYFFNV